jgi:hypothetical protein
LQAPALAEQEHRPLDRLVVHRRSKNQARKLLRLRQSWATIEPTEGVFDFSYLDSTIATCALHEKQVLLRVGTMSGRPAWVDAAVRQNHGKFFRFTDQGVPTKIPVFWDPTFLAKKKALIAALGAHFTNNHTVSIVVVSQCDERRLECAAHSGSYSAMAEPWLQLGLNGRCGCAINRRHP